MMRLAGVRALVTGGASGLGRAIVEHFLAEGARVTVFDRSEAGLAAMTAAHPENVLAVQGDVRDLAANQRAVAETVTGFGGLGSVCTVNSTGCSLSQNATSLYWYPKLGASPLSDSRRHELTATLSPDDVST